MGCGASRQGQLPAFSPSTGPPGPRAVSEANQQLIATPAAISAVDRDRTAEACSSGRAGQAPTTLPQGLPMESSAASNVSNLELKGDGARQRVPLSKKAVDTISDWLVNQFLARGLQYRVLLENQAGTDYPHLRGAKFADLLDTSAISVPPDKLTLIVRHYGAVAAAEAAALLAAGYTDVPGLIGGTWQPQASARSQAQGQTQQQQQQGLQLTPSQSDSNGSGSPAHRAGSGGGASEGGSDSAWLDEPMLVTAIIRDLNRAAMKRYVGNKDGPTQPGATISDVERKAILEMVLEMLQLDPELEEFQVMLMDEEQLEELVAGLDLAALSVPTGTKARYIEATANDSGLPSLGAATGTRHTGGGAAHSHHHQHHQQPHSNGNSSGHVRGLPPAAQEALASNSSAASSTNSLAAAAARAGSGGSGSDGAPSNPGSAGAGNSPLRARAPPGAAAGAAGSPQGHHGAISTAQLAGFQVPSWSLRAMGMRKAEREQAVKVAAHGTKTTHNEELRRVLVKKSIMHQQEILAHSLYSAAKAVILQDTSHAPNAAQLVPPTVAEPAAFTRTLNKALNKSMAHQASMVRRGSVSVGGDGAEAGGAAGNGAPGRPSSPGMRGDRPHTSGATGSGMPRAGSARVPSRAGPLGSSGRPAHAGPGSPGLSGTYDVHDMLHSGRPSEEVAGAGAGAGAGEPLSPQRQRQQQQQGEIQASSRASNGGAGGDGGEGLRPLAQEPWSPPTTRTSGQSAAALHRTFSIPATSAAGAAPPGPGLGAGQGEGGAAGSEGAAGATAARQRRSTVGSMDAMPLEPGGLIQVGGPVVRGPSSSGLGAGGATGGGGPDSPPHRAMAGAAWGPAGAGERPGSGSTKLLSAGSGSGSLKGVGLGSPPSAVPPVASRKAPSREVSQSRLKS